MIPFISSIIFYVIVPPLSISIVMFNEIILYIIVYCSNYQYIFESYSLVFLSVILTEDKNTRESDPDEQILSYLFCLYLASYALFHERKTINTYSLSFLHSR